MNPLTRVMLEQLASQTANRSLANGEQRIDSSPMDRALERLARARAASHTLDTLDSYGILLAIGLGGAAAFARR